MVSGIALLVRFPVDDGALWHLHQSAFGSPAGARRSWAHQLENHSLTWVGAFAEEDLVGFLNVCWDGGEHAFVLDVMVHPRHQRRGIGRMLVRHAALEAAGAGCTWLHVDYEPHLQAFYSDACGFAGTSAGLLRLAPTESS